MKRGTRRTVIAVVLSLSLAAILSLIPLSAQPASSLAIAFGDTYTRDDDASTPADSLGTTESGPGWSVLDYRELGGCCGTPSVSDIAHIEDGSLVVHGTSTNPAWVELDEAGLDLDVQVDAEFLIEPDVDSTDVANGISFLMRNAGYGSDGTVFTPGAVLFDLFPDGSYTLRAFVTGMYDVIEFPPIRQLDSAVFAAADMDGDGVLRAGEPFTMRLVLQGTSFSLYFNDVLQMGINTGLPVAPVEGDRLLFGRNRWYFNPVGVAVRFDNLQQGPLPLTVAIDIKPGSDPNCFKNDDHGVIPVAILGSATLDVAQIDPASVLLEGLKTKTVGKGDKLLAHIDDVNGDGFPDLVAQIQDSDGSFNVGSGSALLTAMLWDGTPLEGSDSICIVS